MTMKRRGRWESTAKRRKWINNGKTENKSKEAKQKGNEEKDEGRR